MLVGLAVGAVAPGVRAVISADAVLYLLVPGLVFDAAFDLTWPVMRRMLAALVGLAVPGVLVTALVVALLLSTLAGLPIGLAFVVGAMVSATDPIAVVATLERLKMPAALRTLIEGESLLNDGTGLALVAIAVSASTGRMGPMESVATFAIVIVASVALGYAAGRIGAALLRAVRNPTFGALVSVAYAYACFAGATLLGLSGVLVTVIAAIAMGHALRQGSAESIAHRVDRLWGVIAVVLSALAFLAIGAAIDLGSLGAEIGAIAVGVLAVLFARGLFVYLPYLFVRSALPLGWAHVLFWSGLRGAIAFAAALALPSDLPQRQLLQNVAFGVVLVTLVAQGTTAPLVVRAALRSQTQSDEVAPSRDPVAP